MKQAILKFMTRKWNIFKDQLNENYGAGNKIIYSTEVLKSNFYNYDASCMVVRDDIAIKKRKLVT